MKKQFISKEIADLVKDKGFNEPCLGVYIKGADDIKVTVDPKDHYYYEDSAPTYEQVIDWLDSKGIYLQIKLLAQFQIEKGWGYELTYTLESAYYNTDEDGFHSNRKSALDEGIKKAVKLI